MTDTRPKKAFDKILSKLFATRKPVEYGINFDSISQLEPIDAFIPGEPESLGGFEATLGTKGILTVSVKHSGGKQFLIHVFLHEPNKPKLTLLYDQTQFQNLDRAVYKICRAALSLHQ